MALFSSRLAQVVGGLALFVSAGCSSEIRRDQYYGTDAGAEYIPPDARTSDTRMTQSSNDALDGSRDTMINLDALPKDTSETADANLDAAAIAVSPFVF